MKLCLQHVLIVENDLPHFKERIESGSNRSQVKCFFDIPDCSYIILYSVRGSGAYYLPAPVCNVALLAFPDRVIAEIMSKRIKRLRFPCGRHRRFRSNKYSYKVRSGYKAFHHSGSSFSHLANHA